jgi:hypothetical protein
MNLQSFKTNMAKEVITGEEAFKDIMAPSDAVQQENIVRSGTNSGTSSSHLQLHQDVWNSLTATKASNNTA